MSQKIYHELVFNWWVKSVLKKMLRIISIVKKRNARYLKKKHNFVVEVPKSIAQKYVLAKNNVNTLW